MTSNIYYNTIHRDDADPRILQEQDLLNLVEYGGLGDWRPLLQALREAPYGLVATKLEKILDLVESVGAAEFFQIKLNHYRGIPLDHVVTVDKPERFWGI
ncbi:hypothetical protein [Nocardia aurantia]|uniref:Uncharacterized protein n=1 Tax=Nocardia aurantia TaxID=2585199 RepID=A0A7K0DGP5_9NOCA|nr:hypothetical protein [Nocardia aurantia]MQY24858.1 hypothetical protein [Nocardia aurantia]